MAGNCAIRSAPEAVVRGPPDGIETKERRIAREMNQGATDIADPADMAAEISKLRGEVARLTRRVEELDELRQGGSSRCAAHRNRGSQVRRLRRYKCV